MGHPTSARDIQRAVDAVSYRYLGNTIVAAWENGMELTRDELRATLIRMIQMIGHLPGLDCAQIQDVIDTVLNGMIGYYGRATPLTWADTCAIEGARKAALARRGFGTGEAWQVYGDHQHGGMNSMHAYQMAAGAYIDTVDRALCLTAGAPVRIAIEWRSVTDRFPSSARPRAHEQGYRFPRRREPQLFENAGF